LVDRNLAGGFENKIDIQSPFTLIAGRIPAAQNSGPKQIIGFQRRLSPHRYRGMPAFTNAEYLYRDNPYMVTSLTSEKRLHGTTAYGGDLIGC
jgi:hypothetical protein